ncbi:unnamed protein product, partial [marine sediment metagenome]
MKKLIYLIVVIVALGLIVVGCNPTVPPTEQGNTGNLTRATVTVLSGGSIQEAIDAASAGDTIEVAAGTYNETISITKSNFTIKSQSGDPSDTIIDANGAGGNVVTIADCSGVTFSGFTITGAATRRNGIRMSGATGCTISNIVVTGIGPLTVG